MERSLIQLSPTTLVISLPAAWIGAHHLQKGSKVQVEENDGSIVVSTQKPKVRSYSVHIPKSGGRLVWHVLDSLYVAGYDEIHITFDESQLAVQLERGIPYFPGFMIVSQSSKAMTLKDITQQAKEDVMIVTHRLFSQILTLFEDATIALANKDANFFSSIKKRDYLINSTVSYCLRQAMKFGNMNHTFFAFLNSLEQYCDVIVDMCEKEALKTKPSKLKEARDFVTNVRTVFEKKTMESYLVLAEIARQSDTASASSQLAEAVLRYTLK
ncbi:MAG TPA: hypothetical protein VK158_06195 [Acidobacteriota bacterium]|nr:hypothetical protein [Acidobacteriota bacterium]